jgi:hypothetical protein
MEVEKFGIHVTAVCPGFTRSEFHARAGAEDLKRALPRFLWMDADTVARQGYEASEAGRFVYVSGVTNKTIAVLARLIPAPLLYGLVRRASGRTRWQ